MSKIVEIFIWIDVVVGAIGITALILALALNFIVYGYETFVGFKTFHKFLRKYHKDMKEERCKKIYYLEQEKTYE